MTTPADLLQAYEEAARQMPWHLRWWYMRKARRARKNWDVRVERELRRVIREERDRD